MSEITYICRVCQQQKTAKKGEPIPLCCHKAMEPLPFCTAVPDPEIARPEADEPCQNGTAPKRE